MRELSAVYYQLIMADKLHPCTDVAFLMKPSLVSRHGSSTPSALTCDRTTFCTKVVHFKMGASLHTSLDCRTT